MASGNLPNPNGLLYFFDEIWRSSFTVTLPHEDCIFMVIAGGGEIVTGLTYAAGGGGRIGTVKETTYIQSVTVQDYVMTVTMKSDSSIAVLLIRN